MKPTEKKAVVLPAHSKWLLLINTLFAAAGALSNTFLNIYLWKLLRDVEQIVLYNFVIFFCTALGYMLAGLVAKRTDRLNTLRLGIGILALFYIFVLVLGPSVGPWYVLLGSLQGIGTGFYSLSYNVLLFEVTEPETRDSFNGVNGLLLAVSAGAAPLVAGLILSALPNRGYHVLFLLSFVFFLAAVLVTWLLHHRNGPRSYHLYVGFHPEEHRTIWWQTLRISLSLGFREGIVTFLPFLMVFLVTKNELLASRYLLLTAIGSLLSYYVVKRFLTFERRMRFATLAAVMLGLSVLMMLFEVNAVSLFVFGILNSLFAPLLMIPYSCVSLDVMGQLPEAVHRKVEYLVVREVVVNTGRCLALLIMIAFETWLSDWLSVRLSFLLVGLSPMVALLFFQKSMHSFRATFLKST